MEARTEKKIKERIKYVLRIVSTTESRSSRSEKNRVYVAVNDKVQIVPTNAAMFLVLNSGKYMVDFGAFT